MVTAIAEVLDAAVCVQPEMVIVLVTAAPASGMVTSVPFVAVQVAAGGAVVDVLVGVAVAVAGEPPPIMIVTVSVVFVQAAAYEVRAAFSAVSTVRPQRVLSTVHSEM